MMVFWEAKLVYLATPKTGSTAIESALRPFTSMALSRTPQLKHTSFNRYQRFLQPFLSTASKTDWRVVAMMREPTDWLNSWYRYRSRDDDIFGRPFHPQHKL